MTLGSVRHALWCAAALSVLEATWQLSLVPPVPLRHPLPRPLPRILRMSSSEPAAAGVPTPAAATAAPAGLKPLVTDNMPKLKPSKIRRGDFVVHSAYGVGRFEGVYNNPRIGKMLRVQFRDDYLEVHPMQRGDIKLFKRKEQVDPYLPVKLDPMHSRNSWQRRKAKAAKNVFKVAADLLAMAAARQNNLQRTPCAPDSKRMLAFEAGFEYEPTEDQHSTFAEVRDDMVDGGKPMDRLICGDVGFGKTEAAMRAAYRAVCNGRQVAFLAPTTVLAAQHLRTLRKRMPDVRVEMMSSLIKRTPAQKADLLEELAQGHVEVLVGTHALLSNTLRWKRLGLLVVDEEQRFGVRQKEKIKNASLAVDVLSLSATPIPRTMYMCMAGIREMSTLHTPPAGRRPVVTRVMTRDQEAIREAILVELERGGQIFYVVPRIEQVTRETQMLRELVPELRLSFGYGGLKDLEQRIVDFTLGGTDLMVSTTIMENGIDIPNVNTIIIQDTHMFGLSQLHQLRGRVGRSNVQAYALMMHPDPGLLGDDALRRLRVLQRESGLGAGFGLAKSDLELRGAGNLFGTEQKGSFGAKEMGVDMYMMVLQRAMRYLEQKAAEGEDIHDAEELIKAANLDASVLLGLSDTLDK